MQSKKLLTILMGLSVTTADAKACGDKATKTPAASKPTLNGNQTHLLATSLIQQASQNDGDNLGAQDQATSATDMANFINFCDGTNLTNGRQAAEGSCNGIPMGKIPAADRMVSAVFVEPENNQVMPPGQAFKLSARIMNLAAGSFTNATSTYYSAPQDLDANGMVIGHTHFTVQDTGATLNPKAPLDPTKFTIFKAVNDAGDGMGLLSANVNDGLPAGNYRVCTLVSAANHQPVLMPMGLRGAQDDCVRFTVQDATTVKKNAAAKAAGACVPDQV